VALVDAEVLRCDVELGVDVDIEPDEGAALSTGRTGRTLALVALVAPVA
jgi:hypothetical protein